MASLKELREDKTKLVLSKGYYAYPEGTEVYVVGEMDGERRGENEVVLKCANAHNTFTMRDDIFWDYLSLPDKVN